MNKLKMVRKTNIIHDLARDDDIGTISRLPHAHNEEKRITVLGYRDVNNKTPYQVVSSPAAKALLNWTREQDGFYCLPTPPAVLIMYSTDERPGTQEECDRLSEALPAFNVETTIRKDPTATEMLRPLERCRTGVGCYQA